jgi:hypothetical protein
VHAGAYGRFVSRTLLDRDETRWRVRAFDLVPLLP